MANIKITDLTAYTDPVSTDVLPIVDVASDVTKKVSIATLMKNASLGSAAACGIAFDGDPNSGLYSPGADQVALATNGNGRLFIASDGKVGCGTSTPSGNFDVIGLSGTTIIRAVGADTNGNADAEIFSTGTTGNSRLYFSDTAAQSGSIVYSHNNNSFAFATAGSTALTIDSSQRVGVGTTPNASSIFQAKAATNSHVAIWDYSATPMILGLKDDGSSQSLRIAGFPLTFTGNGGAGSEHMRITSDGKVGLGTSDPGSYSASANQLVIAGSGDSGLTIRSGTANSSSIYFADGTTGSELYQGIVYYNHTNDSLNFHTNYAGSSSARMVIDSAGNVGVGTTSPSDTSGFGGTLDINGSTGAACYVRTNGSATDYGLIGHYNTDLYINNNSNGPTRFYTNGNERARIDSSGRLLVGTSSDSGGALLQVNGDRVRVATAKTPASASATGTTGEICWDANYVYVCVATNTWKRSALSTW